MEGRRTDISPLQSRHPPKHLSAHAEMIDISDIQIVAFSCRVSPNDHDKGEYILISSLILFCCIRSRNNFHFIGLLTAFIHWWPCSAANKHQSKRYHSMISQRVQSTVTSSVNLNGWAGYNKFSIVLNNHIQNESDYRQTGKRAEASHNMSGFWKQAVSWKKCIGIWKYICVQI